MGLLRWFRVAFVAASALGVSVAFAVEQPANPYPECTRKPTAADTDGAKGAHKAASQFYDRGDYDKAIRYWTDAYSFDCTAHGVLINIANAYEKKGDRAAAVTALETYMKRAGSDATIEEKVKNLKAMMPAPKATATTSASAAPTTAPTSKPPVQHDEGPRPYGVTPWIVAGTGAAAAIAGAVVLGVGMSNYNTAQGLCPIGVDATGATSHLCPAGTGSDATSQGNTGLLEERVGGVLLGVGGAAIVGGLVWQFAFNKPAETESAASRLRVLPVMGPQNAGLSVSGAF